MQRKNSTRAIFSGFLSVIMLASCSKADLVQNPQVDFNEETVITNAMSIDESRVVAGGITLNAPLRVNVNESFDITADYTCGRVSLERGYIIGAGNEKIYKNIVTGMEGLQWESIIRLQDPVSGINYKGYLTETGTYLFRTKHNVSNSQTMESVTGNNSICSFSGNQVYYFQVEAMNSCPTSFTGNVMVCGANNTAVYRFVSANDETNIMIQGELANFMGNDAVVTVTGAAMKVTQSSSNTSTNRVISLEGNVTACSEVVITVSWSSTNYDNVITSDWTVKNAEETDLAPSIPGLECDSRKAGK